MIKINSQIKRYPKGPQFGGRLLIINWVLFILTIIFFALNIKQQNYFLAVLLLLLSAAELAVILNIKGVEIDYSKNLIREYKSLLGWKIGKWENIEEYNRISISKDRLIVKTSIYSNHRHDTFHYYYANLLHKNNEQQITIIEFENYYKAKEFAQNISREMKLEIIDLVKG